MSGMNQTTGVRPAMLIDGVAYLCYSAQEQQERLDRHWQKEKPKCERCGLEVKHKGLYWRMFGLCPDCVDKGEQTDVNCMVVSTPGGGVEYDKRGRRE